MRGLAHAIIEVRQDLIRDPKGQAAWAERLVRIMRGLLARPDLQLNVMKPPLAQAS
jgi:predicted N-formylglutamate amidohydrolase